MEDVWKLIFLSYFSAVQMFKLWQLSNIAYAEKEIIMFLSTFTSLQAGATSKKPTVVLRSNLKIGAKPPTDPNKIPRKQKYFSELNKLESFIYDEVNTAQFERATNRYKLGKGKNKLMF